MDAGLATSVELTVPVDRLGVEAARRLCAQASDLGLAIALAGPAPAVDALGLPGGGSSSRRRSPVRRTGAVPWRAGGSGWLPGGAASSSPSSAASTSSWPGRDSRASRCPTPADRHRR
ncbi:hypothetical protein [Blastococcus brunescens]|uniref:Uncharacterized protein n=1 Tax=Blastococcus brunescens TaxID=1564165 RepID=A0ABZ1B1G9_9ACTN|nr:hypothetical protein [Blastococcus sp. BMG 8361]WRL63184.1 hypothetical protein U6N30_25880 [Blastococcus sp. BMG 8361]